MTMRKTASFPARMMRKTTSKPEIFRNKAGFGTAALALALSLPAALVLPAAPARAQHGPVQRVVEGTVENTSGAIIKGAVVYLKDTKSLAVKSFVSTDAGTFHFGQLSPDTDYDIWAELQGKKSKTKSISQFNSKTSFHYTLKIED